MYLKSEKAQAYFVQETHSIETDERFWSNQWGDKILFSHGSNRSAGVAILLNNFPGKVTATKKDLLGHWIICVFETGDRILILGNIYGYNNHNQNKNLLIDLTNTVKDLSKNYVDYDIFMGGDFNVVMDEWLDRYPTRFQNYHYNTALLELCNSLKLIDIWRYLNPDTQIFTWFKPDGTIKSRLDYWLVSDISPDSEINCTISAAPLTDHCLVKINVTPSNMRLDIGNSTQTSLILIPFVKKLKELLMI